METILAVCSIAFTYSYYIIIIYKYIFTNIYLIVIITIIMRQKFLLVVIVLTKVSIELIQEQ